MSVSERHVRLFRNGRNQALCIPREFELPGDEAILRQENGCLLIEPVAYAGDLLGALAELEPLEKELPNVDQVLLPLDDVDL